MQTAKIFKSGGSQAVRLPASFRFDVDEVAIRRDAQTGDVILSARRSPWTSWLEFVEQAEALGSVTDVLMERDQPLHQERDPFR
jgi:antitoxin VapB